MFTSYFGAVKQLPPDLVPVSIARWPPRGWKGRREIRLAPKPAMLKMLREDYDREFEAILADLNPEEIFTALGENAVLLCWEPPNVWCHRRRVAEWLEEALGIVVPEWGFPRGDSLAYRILPESPPKPPQNAPKTTDGRATHATDATESTLPDVSGQPHILIPSSNSPNPSERRPSGENRSRFPGGSLFNAGVTTMKQVKVTVVEFDDRAHYQLQWRDPITGRKRTKSTKQVDPEEIGVLRTGRKREREKAKMFAMQLQVQLNAGQYKEPSKLTWEEFRSRYEREVLPGLADGTTGKVLGVFRSFERICGAKKLADVTAERVSYYQSKLREDGLAEDTIAGNLAHLKAALRWAERMGMVLKAPVIERPRRAKGSRAKVMKGRPITREEFERMLDAVPVALFGKPKEDDKPLTPHEKAARDEIVQAWRYYLEGLWCSGLRLQESLELYWDRDDKLSVDLSGEHPMLRIPAELEKGNRDRVLPMAPEFAEFLLKTPESNRRGRVFKLTSRRGGAHLCHYRVSEIASLIGEKAGVRVASRSKVDPETGKTVEVPKFASAHDLRRSFGERWSKRIMPPDLMILMRHESIETTLRYYVGRNAQSTARTLWEAYKKIPGNTPGNSGQNGQTEGDADETQRLTESGFRK